VHLVTFERRAPTAGAPPPPGKRRRGRGSVPRLELGEAGGVGARRLGALVPSGPRAGDVVDLNRALALRSSLDDAGAPEAEADCLIPSDALAFLRRLERSLPAAERALAFALEASERFDLGHAAERLFERRRDVRLLAPVLRPGKIVAVARNYAAHAKEAGSVAPPEEPVLFLKAPSAVIGPEDDIVLPRASREVDFEGELAAVIGRAARELRAEEALDFVAGYCVANDVSARDFQNVRGQHFIGKSCDGFAPLGPALVTRDEVPDPQDLAIRTIVSGEQMQSARTKEMIFPVAAIVAFASRLMTLEPGDVILTGTPAGVGMARNPPRWLREGDVVEVSIERVGRLVSYVAKPTEDEA